MADIITGRVFTDGEKGITAQKLNDIQGLAVIQPDFVGTKPATSTLDPTDQLLDLKSNNTYARISGAQIATSVAGQLPLASATQPGMLATLSGNTTDFLDGTNHFQALNPAIWAVRQLTYSSVGNPGFEVDQRNCGTAVTVGTGTLGPMICDRWAVAKSGSATYLAQQADGGTGFKIPGSNYIITKKYFLVTLTAAVSPAAGDYMEILQVIEGSWVRELFGGVSSISLICQSSVPNLAFNVGLSDGSNSHSLSKLCTLGAANTPVVFTLPNLPSMSGVSGGSFSLNPGAAGYLLRIGLTAGTNLIPPANDVWQSGAYVGAVGMTQFSAQPVNSNFILYFIQHEPGALCSTFLDKPWPQNYDECLRYYQKSYDYGQTPGTITGLNLASFFQNIAGTSVYGHLRFHKPVAKTPTVILWDNNNGVAGSVMDNNAVHHTGAVAQYVGTTGFGGINFNTATTGALPVFAQFTVDTGW